MNVLTFPVLWLSMHWRIWPNNFTRERVFERTHLNNNETEQHYGKAVRVRHCPATVSAETWPKTTERPRSGRRPQVDDAQVRRPVLLLPTDSQLRGENKTCSSCTRNCISCF